MLFDQHRSVSPSRCTRRAGRRPLGSQAEDPPPPLPLGRHSACLHHTPPLPSPLRGKEAAGAGVAAGASCPCDRAEPGIRGHVGKTLVPAALPARNAPPAPQPPPAWPRNGDSPAPCSCSHPLIVHPPQPTAGPAAGFPASLPLLQLVFSAWKAITLVTYLAHSLISLQSWFMSHAFHEVSFH